MSWAPMVLSRTRWGATLVIVDGDGGRASERTRVGRAYRRREASGASSSGGRAALAAGWQLRAWGVYVGWRVR
jgi:hypothetical protein